MNGQTLEEADEFKYLRSTKPKYEYNKVIEDQTGAITLSHDKAGNAIKQQSRQFFPQRGNINGTSECLAYYRPTESMKQTNVYGNRRSISSMNVRSFYWVPSVASYHGSAMSSSWYAAKGHSWYYKEQWIVVVAEEYLVNQRRTTSRNGHGQLMLSLPHITDDRGRRAIIAADASVGAARRRLGVMGHGYFPNISCNLAHVITNQ